MRRISSGREFRRESRIPTTLSSPPSKYLKRFSPSLSPVSTTSVLPYKLHRIACCDVSQLSVLFSSSLLYDRVVRRENAGLLFSLVVVTQITWIVRLPKSFEQCHFCRDIFSNIPWKHFAFVDEFDITIIQFNAFLYILIKYSVL